ncbi:MAG: apolipoprotein N-acyltransferase [Alphaproteobacteria bacterium]|nr:apolipoprotein N-acyltransferase [Alphaproteobacteria bacterium]
MKVFVDVHDKRWKKYKIDFEKIAYTAVPAVYKDSEVSVVLVDDEEIRAINKQYRNLDKPTNVLSFELGDDILLGDIYISLDTVVREAKELNISVHDHVAHMLVHGVLHLLGFDHITDEEAAVMELKETNILKKMGIKNPYAQSVGCVGGSCCPGSKTIAWFKRLKIKENGLLQYLLYGVFGGVAALGFAPFYQWWWTLIGVGGAYWLTVKNNNIGGFWKSFLRVFPFGAVYALAMFWWVLHSIYEAPEIAVQYAIWTVPGVIGLLLAGGFIFSWPFVIVAYKKANSAARIWLFACSWVLVLWLREWLFTGFPWNPIANITMTFPVLANSMSVWGALGLSYIILGIIASVVELLRNKKKKSVLIVLFIFLCSAVYGVFAGVYNMNLADEGAGTPTTILRLVQPASSQSQKATHNRAEALQRAEYNLKKLIDLAMLPGEYDVVVMPETAYPFVVVETDEIKMASFLKKPIIFGANSFGDGGMFNSMVISAENGRIEKIYSKSHLVPFGEYRPLGVLPAPVNLKQGNGPDLIGVDGFVFAPAICYEIIFSDSLVPDNSGEVHAIVNITNDNWFGNTPGTYQHLDMVRRYAIESGLPIVRANYSGISAFVASDGAIISSLPVGEVGVLDGFVWGAHNTIYRTIGLNMWMIIILIVSIFGVRAFSKKE